MAGFRIEGYSGTVADVDNTTDRQLQVRVNDDSTKSGLLAATARSDDGVLTGSILDINPEPDQDYRLRVAQDRLDFLESWAGSALNSAQWSSNVTTMTTAVGTAELQMNANSSTTANAVARVTSYRTFAMPSPSVLAADFTMRVVASSLGILNTTWEVGFFIASGTTAPTDGVFLRMNASGELRLVASFNGSETQSGTIAYSATPTGWATALIAPYEARGIILTIHDDAARLWIDDELAAQVNSTTSAPMPTVSQALPFSARIYNGASTPATATQLRLGPVSISIGGIGANTISLAEASALMGGGGYQGQSGGTMGLTANYANSAAPAAASLSNSAAGYTTLGGQWQFAAVAGAETDYVLFGYQVPAVAAGSHNKNLLIYGINISTVNTVAAVATSSTVMQWSIAVGSTAVSLTTGEAATTKAPRRITLGIQTFPVGAAIGATATDITRTFAVPLLAEAGTFVQVILKMPIGTATATEVFRGVCAIDAVWV